MGHEGHYCSSQGQQDTGNGRGTTLRSSKTFTNAASILAQGVSPPPDSGSCLLSRAHVLSVGQRGHLGLEGPGSASQNPSKPISISAHVAGGQIQ